MSKKHRDILLRYGISFAIGAGMVLLTLDLHHYAQLTTPLERYRLLSNAFTIPGSVLLMVGLLVMISGAGAYEGLGYVLRWLKNTLIPFDKDKQEQYYEYVQRKRSRPNPKGGFLVLTGLVFLAVAIVFLILFYRVKNG